MHHLTIKCRNVNIFFIHIILNERKNVHQARATNSLRGKDAHAVVSAPATAPAAPLGYDLVCVSSLCLSTPFWMRSGISTASHGPSPSAMA